MESGVAGPVILASQNHSAFSILEPLGQVEAERALERSPISLLKQAFREALILRHANLRQGEAFSSAESRAVDIFNIPTLGPNPRVRKVLGPSARSFSEQPRQTEPS